MDLPLTREPVDRSQGHAVREVAGSGVGRVSNGPAVLVGRDPKMLEIVDLVDQVADTTATILIAGECGTGKEVVARMIHQRSRRNQAPFVAVNCGAIPETLQESTLFGHLRGAFTGADSRQLGVFDVAANGTVYLDEISETTNGFQVKLLRVLQSGEYLPVGSGRTQSCDVRVISATNRDLVKLIAAGEFRQDLYYRLNIIRIEMPPLRERRDDIPLLVNHFLMALCGECGKPEMTISASARKLLMDYAYPGNVRELKNILHRAVILCRDAEITERHIPCEVYESNSVAEPCPAGDFHAAKAMAVERFERGYLTQKLRESGGIVSRAARNSGLSERNFFEKLKKYGLSSRRFRA